MSKRSFPGFALQLAAILVAVLGLASAAWGQSLNLEGQTGGLVTPFAYTTPSEPGGISFPAAAFHLVSGGDIVGTHFQISLTAGALNRLEFGYTRSAVSVSTDDAATGLFDRGFSIVHAKAILLPEGTGGTGAPAIAAGFVVRFQKQHIERGLGVATKNGDVFVVVTKTFNQIEQAPIVLSGGVKATSASLFGFAGNAPGWSPCGFLFGGINLGGRVLVGAEYAQQPKEIDGIEGSDVPGTVTFLARFTPDPQKRLSIDVSVVSLGGDVGGGIDIKAKNRFAFGVGYRF